MKRNTFTRVLKSLLLILFILGVGEVGWGQTSISAFNSPLTQNFDGLVTANGTWSNNSTLPGWYVKTDLTATISNYYLNNGSVVTPGELCSFGTTNAGDRALGYIPSASFTGASGTGKGYIGWRLKNNTSKSIGSFQVNWTGEQWRKEVAGSQNIVLSYQIGNSVSDLTSGTYTLAASQFDSPITVGSSATVLNGNTAANRVVLTKTLNITIPAGQEIMFRWEDLNDPANHLLAIDDISFTALKESQTITFSVLGPRPYINGSTFALGATASSGLSVTYVSNNSGVISISGSTATIHSAGQATITASQAGNGTYVAAVDVLQVQIIVPAAPVATSATSILSSGFSANWNASSGGAEEYWVYVSTDNFVNPDNELIPASAFAALTMPVSGLMPNTTYYYRIRAKAGTEYSPYSNIIQVTTGAGVQTFNITQSVNGFTATTLTWENGNLDNRVVFLKEGIGTCPNPTNDNAYTSSTDWTVKGDQIGSSGFFCIYDGSGSTVDLTNLYPGRTYTVQAFEYSGGYFTEKYLTNVSGANNPITFAPWGTTTFINTTPGQVTAENWTTAARWDHVTVPTAALHSAVLVYIDGNCEVTTTVVANNLTINATHSTINPKLSITPNHTLTINNTLTNNNGTGGLVINSDETGTGSLMHNTANVNATVQRYISGTPNLLAKKYHLVSVPINSTTYLSNVWLDSYLFTYIESTNLWHIWDSPTTNTFWFAIGTAVAERIG